MFDADHPITTAKADRLKRDVFSKYLARCILDHTDPESLVIGLAGGWGVGKTSILNMAIEEINLAAINMFDYEKPIILNFSPWSYSGQQQIIYNFFRRLSATFRRVEYLENREQIIHLLELYVSFFTDKPIPKVLQPKIGWLQKLSFKMRKEAYGWESGRDLTLVKAELNQLLAQQKHKIIIVIDNISRLYPKEIQQIFQIVKSMGDYAHTAYLLAYDKEEIIHSLKKVDGIHPESYLEKIVQLSFEVPPILEHDIENILADHLELIIKTIPEDAWQKEYWADVYYNALKFFFKNCRDITRYLNTLSFSYTRVKELVNPIDFFALTALEVFYPAIYAGIRDNKDLFTDLLEQVYQFDTDLIQKDKTRCDEILIRATEDRENILNLLLILFPRLRHIYQPHLPLYHSQSIARKLKRVCCPDIFEVYFRLSMQSGSIPANEFHTILALAADKIMFDQALTRLNQDERVTAFLEQLDGPVLQTIPLDHSASIIFSLLDNGDLFPKGLIGPLQLGTLMRIHRIIHQLLRRHEKPEDRFKLLEHSIKNTTKSIHVSVYELMQQAREHNEEEDVFVPLIFRDVNETQLKSLQHLAVARIVDWAKMGRLGEHPDLRYLLTAWYQWGDTEECKNYVQNLTNTDRGIVAFLCAFLNFPIKQAMTLYEKNASWEKYLEEIELFISREQLAEHAKELFEDDYFEKLKEEEQLAIMIFLDLIKVHTKKTIPKTTV